VATTSRVQVEAPQKRLPIAEEIGVGDDVEFDWEWWGSSKSNSCSINSPVVLMTTLAADGEAEDETTRELSASAPKRHSHSSAHYSFQKFAIPPM
jgi:hypothetical protein